MNQKVIITGITGFVGQHLKVYLKNYFNVIGVYRKQNKLTFENIKLEDLNNINAVVHLAGKAHDLKNVTKPEEYFEVNTELTKQLFDLFLKSNSKTFIYLSSLKAVADHTDFEITEEDKPNPISPYGKSKLEAENYILSKSIKSNKRVIILRPCMIYGPNNKGNLALLNSFIIKGIPYPFKNFKNLRSFLYIENLSFVIKEIISQDSFSSGVYNISDGNPISTLSLVINLANIQKKKILTPFIPRFIIKFIGRLGDLMPLPINTERLNKLTTNYYCSNKKLLNSLKKPLQYTTFEGLKKTFEN